MVGKKLSHYKIVAELGRGGMGIVYKGEDTKLHRTVAIKVLPAAALSSEDDRARFYREARAAASLSHSNIATVYEIDEAVPEGAKDDDLRPFIAMEFVDGDTLDERIKRGPFKLEEAIRIATQIAQALGEAHENDIVHRDIKAQNVMITAKGDSKVLDFGLAQTAQSTKLTRMGSTVGTIANMSPEQARGEEVDLRTDLWSLGVILYEMIAGRSPFPGEYEQAVVYAILNQDVEPLTAVRTAVPMALEWIVAKCLAKDASDRYQRAEDLLVDLRTVDLSAASGMSRVPSGSRTTEHISTPAASRKWYRSPSALLSVVAAFLAGLLLMFSISRPTNTTTLKPLKRFTTSVPGLLVGWFPRLSADGSKVAYVGQTQENLYTAMLVYDLSTDQTLRFGNQYSAGFSAFSTDGNQLVYGSVLGLSRIPLDQGIPVRISNVPVVGLVHWLDQETVLYGGTTSIQTWNHVRREEANYLGSDYLGSLDVPPEGVAGLIDLFPIPKNKAALATVLYVDPEKKPDLAFVSNGSAKILFEGAAWGKFSRDGFLTYTALDAEDFMRGRLMSQLFDPREGTLEGNTVPVVPDPDLPFFRYDISDDGTVWITNMGIGLSLDWPLAWVDPVTGVSTVVGKHDHSTRPSISPDGNTIAFGRWSIEEGRNDVYLLDLKRGTEQLLATNGQTPVWYPDGKRVLFYREQAGDGLYEIPVDLSSTATAIEEDALGSPAIAPEGNWIAFSRAEAGEIHLYVLEVESGTEQAIDDTALYIINPHFSPQGNFIAAQHGLDNDAEIVVYQFPDGRPIRLSDAVGETPHWSADGKWIYFLSDRLIKRIPISTDGIFQVLGPPEIVSKNDEEFASFAVSTDGRILGVRIDNVSYPDETAWVIQNWGDELRRQLSASSN